MTTIEISEINGISNENVPDARPSALIIKGTITGSCNNIIVKLDDGHLVGHIPFTRGRPYFISGPLEIAHITILDAWKDKLKCGGMDIAQFLKFYCEADNPNNPPVELTKVGRQPKSINCNPVPCPVGFSMSKITVKNSTGEEMDPDNCMPPGVYSLNIVWEGITPPAGQYEWHKDEGPRDNSITGQHPTVTHDNADHTYVVRYVLTENGDCDYLQSVTMKACAPCPTLNDIEVIVDSKCDNDRRLVTINTTVNPNNVETTARLILVKPDGTSEDADSRTLAAPFSLNMTRVLSAGSYSARVETNQPDCGSREKPFSVNACDGPPPPPPPQETTVSSVDWCSIFRFMALAGFAVLALGWLILCPDILNLDPRAHYAIASVVLGGGFLLTVVGLILWIAACRPGWCEWRLMFAQFFWIVGFILLYALFCPVCWIVGLMGIASIMVGFFLFVFWAIGIPALKISGCNPSTCDILNELLLCFVVIDLAIAALNIALVVLGVIACPMPWWRVIHAAIISAWTAILLARMNTLNCRL